MHDPTTLHAELRATDEADQIGYARYLCEQYLQIHADHGPTWLRLAGHLISLAQYTTAEIALDRAESLAPEVQLHRILTQRGHLHAAQPSVGQAHGDRAPGTVLSHPRYST